MGLLSSITDTLFGSKPSSSVQTLPTFSPEQQKIFTDILAPFLEGLDLDPSLLDTSEAQATSLAGLEERALALATQPTSSQQVLAQIFGEGVSPDFTGATQSGLNRFADPELFDELFKTGVTDPALREFNETILPGIGRRFSPSGFFGNERIKADERALEDLLQSLTGERARGFLDTGLQAALGLEESRRGDLDRSLQQAFGTTEARLRGVAAGGVEGVDIGSLTQIIQSADFQRLNENQKIQIVLQALGLQSQENIATVTGGTQGLLSGFLGTEAGAGGVASLLGLA